MKKVLILTFALVAMLSLSSSVSQSEDDNISKSIHCEEETQLNATNTIYLSKKNQLIDLEPIKSDTIVLQAKTLKTKEIIPQMPNYDITMPKEYQEALWKLCLDNKRSYEEMLSIAFKENSTFDPKRVSEDGHDKGLFQVRDTPKLHAWHLELMGREFDYFNPYDNMELAIKIIASCENVWIDKIVYEKMLYYSLNTYNMGQGSFSKYLSKYGEKPRDYSTKIALYMENLIKYGSFVEKE